MGKETARDGLHDFLKNDNGEGKLEDVVPLGLREALDVENNLRCVLFAVSRRLGTPRLTEQGRPALAFDALVAQAQEQGNAKARQPARVAQHARS